MKKCTYCGRESPDAASHCHECGTPLIKQQLSVTLSSTVSPGEVSPEAKTTKEQLCSYYGRVNEFGASNCHGCGTPLLAAAIQPSLTPSTTEPTEVKSPAPIGAHPESWSARDAWKSLGMMLVFSFMLSSVSGALWTLLHWHRTGLSHLMFALGDYTINILTALYFARTESWAAFQKAFGFERGSTTYTWFAIASTLIIRGIGHTLIAAGWAKGVHTTSISGFQHTFGLERYLYVFPLVVLAPLCEEIYMRGFLYRAFRGSYSVELSVLLIVAVTAFTHWDQFRQSLMAAIDISAITIVQCYLREKTGRLQDCIACHLVYNASGLLLSAMRT